MHREPKQPPMKTWQIFSAAFYYLKKDRITKLFGVTKRQMERWAADPATTESHSPNPIDKIETMIEKFMACGQVEVARILAGRFAYKCGCELRQVDPVEPDKDSVHDECLDDYPALVQMHESIRGGDDPELIRHLAQKAKKEIDETLSAYRLDRSGE